MKIVTRSALILALSVVSTLAAAGSPSANPDPSSVRVPLSDLDLSSSAGQSAALNRIHKAAGIACKRSMNPYDLVPLYKVANCVAASQQRALEQIQRPGLVAKK